MKRRLIFKTRKNVLFIYFMSNLLVKYTYSFRVMKQCNNLKYSQFSKM